MFKNFLDKHQFTGKMESKFDGPSSSKKIRENNKQIFENAPNKQDQDKNIYRISQNFGRSGTPNMNSQVEVSSRSPTNILKVQDEQFKLRNEQLNSKYSIFRDENKPKVYMIQKNQNQHNNKSTGNLATQNVKIDLQSVQYSKQNNTNDSISETPKDSKLTQNIPSLKNFSASKIPHTFSNDSPLKQNYTSTIKQTSHFNQNEKLNKYLSEKNCLSAMNQQNQCFQNNQNNLNNLYSNYQNNQQSNSNINNYQVNNINNYQQNNYNDYQINNDYPINNNYLINNNNDNQINQFKNFQNNQININNQNTTNSYQNNLNSSQKNLDFQSKNLQNNNQISSHFLQNYQNSQQNYSSLDIYQSIDRSITIKDLLQKQRETNQDNYLNQQQQEQQEKQNKFESLLKNWKNSTNQARNINLDMKDKKFDDNINYERKISQNVKIQENNQQLKSFQNDQQNDFLIQKQEESNKNYFDALIEKNSKQYEFNQKYGINKDKKQISQPEVKDNIKTLSYQPKQYYDFENQILDYNLEQLIDAENIDQIQKLFKQKNQSLNINQKFSQNKSVLHLAAAKGNSRLVTLFLYHEAQIDSLDNYISTPLTVASQLGFDSVLIILINAGANINHQDLQRNTPLHYACLNGHKKVVEILLNKQSIDLELVNKKNQKPFDCCQSKEIQDMFDEILTKKKNMRQKSIQVPIFQAKQDKIQKMFVNGLAKKVDEKEKQFKPSQFSHQITNLSNINPNKLGKVGPKNFTIHGLIGKGSFGEVYLVEQINTSKLYAMKVLHKNIIINQNLVRYAMTERNVLSFTNHPFIVKLNYAFQTEDKLFLILDCCPGGDLAEHLQLQKRFSEDVVRIYMAEIILALEDMHKKDIIYRDLKPDNIVLDKDGHAMLTDFGLSKEGIQDQTTGTRSFCGSVAYLAPEMIKKCGHGKAVDWYLLGVVIYELLVGSPPYYTNNRDELFLNIQKAPLKLPSHLSEDVKSLLKGLLQRNPLKRLGSGKGDSEEIKFHPFFKQINWTDVINRKLTPPIYNKKLKLYKKYDVNVFDNQTSTFQKDHIKGWSFINDEI